MRQLIRRQIYVPACIYINKTGSFIHTYIYTDESCFGSKYTVLTMMDDNDGIGVDDTLMSETISLVKYPQKQHNHVKR